MASQGKGIIIGASLIGLGWYLTRKARHMTDRQLTEHFRLSEFLRSGTVPSIVQYEPTVIELENLLRHASYLENIREMYGPVSVTGGLRPDSFRALYWIDRKGARHDTPEGISMTDALRKNGYPAALTSDHIPGNGSDIRFLRVHDTNRYIQAYKAIANLLDTRQVILYLTRAADGSLLADHLHVSNVAPGYPKESGDNYAWIEIDGKRITHEGGLTNV